MYTSALSRDYQNNCSSCVRLNTVGAWEVAGEHSSAILVFYGISSMTVPLVPLSPSKDTTTAVQEDPELPSFHMCCWGIGGWENLDEWLILPPANSQVKYSCCINQASVREFKCGIKGRIWLPREACFGYHSHYSCLLVTLSVQNLTRHSCWLWPEKLFLLFKFNSWWLVARSSHISLLHCDMLVNLPCYAYAVLFQTTCIFVH